jgi:DnaJ-class molecular chaperone
MALIATKWIEKDHLIEYHNSVCQTCRGEGKFKVLKGTVEMPCTECLGKGIVRLEKDIKLTIKPIE